MSPSYISAVSANLPKATIVFDHFHIIKMFNDKLSDLRRTLYHKASEEEQGILKGTRWLLLKNPDNLNEEHNECAIRFIWTVNPVLSGQQIRKS